MLLEWRLTWQKCPLALCLAGLFLLGIAQVVPLPEPLLARLSPGTVRLCGELLPAQSETLPGGEAKEAVARPAGSTISLAPGATRRALLQFLPVLMLFAVVRNNLGSTAALRRLSVAAVANGTLLALFALLQFFTSPHDTLYWTFPSQGQVFGPFICRNHFPFYLNVCVGLAGGLLVSLVSSGAGPARRDEVFSPAALLQDPRCLWVTVALAVMVSSVVFSLSRGGVLALVGGGLVGLLARCAGPRQSLATVTLLTIFLTFGLLDWFGLPRVEARLGTLWRGDALEDGRLPMWRNVLGGVKDFPVWGTGYGTFRHVEPLSRQPGDDPTVDYEHAHNDYLEALVEGGLLRLVLSLATVAFVYRLGWRALRRYRGQPGAGLVLGALVGLTTVFLHSAVDFGLHLPAIAFLAAVVCAHLAALGAEPEGQAGGAAGVGDKHTLRLWGLGPVAGVAACAALGWLLVDAGWRSARADQFRLAALRARGEPGPEARERQIRALEAAVGRAPQDDSLQVALAGAYTQAFKEQSARRATVAQATAVARAVAAFASPGPPSPAAAAWSAALTAQQEVGRADDEELARRYLTPALRHYLRARDSCPLLVVPQVQLAALRDRLGGADPRGAYLERATRLRPSDAEIWYLAGAQQLLDGEQARACQSWRRSLGCSEAFLGEIVRGSSRVLGPDGVVSEVFPDRPDLLFRAASEVDPQAEGGQVRAAILTRALALLQEQPGRRQANDLHLEALIRNALGQPAEALDAYRAALARDPLQAGWRYEFARLLYQQERLHEAERELHAVLREQPDNGEARELLETVLQGLLDKD